MPFIPVPDVTRVVVKAKTIAMEWSFGLWFSYPGFDRTDMEALLDYIETTMLPEIALHLEDSTYFSQLVAYDMRAVDGEKVVRGVNILGQVTDAPAVISNSLVISFYGSQRGPWNQGRVYISGLADTQVSASTIDTGTAALIYAAFEALRLAGPTPWQWCCVSKTFDNQPRAEGISTPVTSVAINSYVVGTQKRRLPR